MADLGSGSNTEWWHIWLAAITALWGGLVSYFRKLQDGQPHSWLGVIMHLTTSGFAGLLCWLACLHVEAPMPITAICTGLAGHAGVEFIRLIQKRFLSKVGSN